MMYRTAILATAAVLALAGQASAVTLSTFVSSPPGSPVGFTYAGNKFVGTVLGDGTNILYQTDLSGGSVTTVPRQHQWHRFEVVI